MIIGKTIWSQRTETKPGIKKRLCMIATPLFYYLNQ